MHERLAVLTNHSSVNTCGHNAEGIACGDEAIIWIKFFVNSLNDRDIRQIYEAAVECSASILFGM